ncbi:MAG: MYG1 family protein [archaeon]
MKTVATHDGRFHKDEIFAVAILKIIYPNIKVIRSRDPEIFSKADIRVDVGLKYNPKTNDFDHHQNEFNEKRENGVYYSSCGLIWKHFWKGVVESKEVALELDGKLFQPIDAEDNGINLYDSGPIKPYTLREISRSFFPIFEDKEEINKAFMKVVDLAVNIIKNEINMISEIVKARTILKNKIEKSNEEYLVLDKYIPWKKYVIENTDLKYVVHPGHDKKWVVVAVPIKNGDYRCRKDFPREWAGLVGEDLAKVTGVKDAYFCHKSRFIVSTKTKEGAIKIVKLALKK